MLMVRATATKAGKTTTIKQPIFATKTKVMIIIMVLSSSTSLSQMIPTGLLKIEMDQTFLKLSTTQTPLLLTQTANPPLLPPPTTRRVAGDWQNLLVHWMKSTPGALFEKSFKSQLIAAEWKNISADNNSIEVDVLIVHSNYVITIYLENYIFDKKLTKLLNWFLWLYKYTIPIPSCTAYH